MLRSRSPVSSAADFGDKRKLFETSTADDSDGDNLFLNSSGGRRLVTGPQKTSTNCEIIRILLAKQGHNEFS